MLGEKLLSTSFLGLDRFPIKVWKVLNLADRIQGLWVGQKMFVKKDSSSIFPPEGNSNRCELGNLVLPVIIPGVWIVVGFGG